MNPIDQLEQVERIWDVDRESMPEKAYRNLSNHSTLAGWADNISTNDQVTLCCHALEGWLMRIEAVGNCLSFDGAKWYWRIWVNGGFDNVEHADRFQAAIIAANAVLGIDDN